MNSIDNDESTYHMSTVAQIIEQLTGAEARAATVLRQPFGPGLPAAVARQTETLRLVEVNGQRRFVAFDEREQVVAEQPLVGAFVD